MNEFNRSITKSVSKLTSSTTSDKNLANESTENENKILIELHQICSELLKGKNNLDLFWSEFAEIVNKIPNVTVRKHNFKTIPLILITLYLIKIQQDIRKRLWLALAVYIAIELTNLNFNKEAQQILQRFKLAVFYTTHSYRWIWEISDNNKGLYYVHHKQDIIDIIEKLYLHMQRDCNDVRGKMHISESQLKLQKQKLNQISNIAHSIDTLFKSNITGLTTKPKSKKNTHTISERDKKIKNC